MVRLAGFVLPRTFRQWVVILSPLFIVLAYVLIASYKIRFPGTQYDEALYVNAALGGVDQTSFITKTFHGFPILLMPYIGALKAYIFFPVFALFGVTPLTMRLPVILLTAASLYVLYRLLCHEIGRRLSLCVLLITALSASFIMFTRLDNGPVVLDFFLKVLGLASLLSFARNHRWQQLLYFWVCMLLGVFNKLNFIWYVDAFLGGFLLVYGHHAWKQWASVDRRRFSLISVTGYVFCIAYYLYINYGYHLQSSLGFVGWHTFSNTFLSIVTGSWFYNYALSPEAIGMPILFWLQLAVIGLGLLSASWLVGQRLPRPRFIRFYYFVMVCLVLLLAQVAVTRQATAGWHYFSIYPFFGILFVLSLVMISILVWPRRRRLITFGVIGICLMLSALQLELYSHYVMTYKVTPANLAWSPAIYNLSTFTKTHRQAQFVSLDWGTQTQLMGFDGVRDKYYEVFGPISTDHSASSLKTLEAYITSKPEAYYIVHSRQSIFPEVSHDFFILARSYGYRAIHVTTIKDHDTPVFEIYQLRPVNYNPKGL